MYPATVLQDSIYVSLRCPKNLIATHWGCFLLSWCYQCRLRAKVAWNGSFSGSAEVHFQVWRLPYMRPKATPLSRGDIVRLLCQTDCCVELLAISVGASSTESRASCQNFSKTFTSQTAIFPPPPKYSRGGTTNKHIIEGSLEAKLPTIWIDEKQSREEAERRERLEERRSEKRKSQKKEDADARKGRHVVKH